jgi:transcription initiation factor TFIIH subunit 1
MIKVFVSENPADEPIPSIFTFTNPTTARTDCDTIQEAIKTATADRSSTPKSVADILKDGEPALLANTDLQMSLLKADAELTKLFRNLVMEGPLSAEQFWRARVHLLRGHAIERVQARGPYNVLATLKPKTQDGTTKLVLPPERIKELFEQHPLIKRVYDENVPKVLNNLPNQPSLCCFFGSCCVWMGC